MEPGDVSNMITVGQLGYFVYVQDKEEPEIAPGNDTYEEARETLEFSYSNFLLRNAMNELFDNGFPEGMEIPRF
jgi:hypothetical protein